MNNSGDKQQTGIDILRGIMLQDRRSPMHELFGIEITQADVGKVALTAVPGEKFYNPMQRVHGGFAATLIDSAMGCAVLSSLDRNTGFGTVQLNINYVRKIDVASGKLTCHCQLLHRGRTMLTAEAKLVDANELLYAHATGTFLIYPQ